MIIIQNNLGEIMDLREALYIVNIHKNNGISNASKILNISQSSLSRCLQGIEDSIGEPLFIRSSGQYTPTYIGEQYLNYASQLLSVEEQWNNSLSKHKNPEYGSVTLSIPSIYSTCIMPDVLQKFYAVYPFINLDIIETNHTSASETLNCDINISMDVPSDLDHSKNILAYDEIVLCTPRSCNLKEKSFHVEDSYLPSIGIEQILECRFIMMKDCFISKYVDSHLDTLHITPSIATTTTSYNMALQLVESNFGLTFLPYSVAMCPPHNKNLNLYHYQNQRKSLALSVSLANSDSSTEYIEYLLELIREKCDSFFRD